MKTRCSSVIDGRCETRGIWDGHPVKLRVGDVTFDSDSRQLLRGPKEIHLSPKAFDLLKALIDARPRVLTKNELHQRLWPDTFVSDTNLASLIAEIREALGDNARQPRFIRTAQRVGYAFCAGVDEAIEPATTAGSSLCWLIKDGQRVPLQAGENILGRDGDDGIRIDSPTVSRRHARIVISAAGALLEDLGSKNRTFLRGEQIAAAVRLNDGDEIRLGSVVLRFRSASGSRTATWTEPR
jgi:DNA-binding winged helix-turn-helix (wHTH) protein